MNRDKELEACSRHNYAPKKLYFALFWTYMEAIGF
jgi:hypothetical protein